MSIKIVDKDTAVLTLTSEEHKMYQAEYLRFTNEQYLDGASYIPSFENWVRSKKALAESTQLLNE